MTRDARELLGFRLAWVARDDQLSGRLGRPVFETLPVHQLRAFLAIQERLSAAEFRWVDDHMNEIAVLRQLGIEAP